jgi:hypothetical protein
MIFEIWLYKHVRNIEKSQKNCKTHAKDNSM